MFTNRICFGGGNPGDIPAPVPDVLGVEIELMPRPDSLPPDLVVRTAISTFATVLSSTIECAHPQ